MSSTNKMFILFCILTVAVFSCSQPPQGRSATASDSNMPLPKSVDYSSDPKYFIYLYKNYKKYCAYAINKDTVDIIRERFGKDESVISVASSISIHDDVNERQGQLFEWNAFSDSIYLLMNSLDGQSIVLSVYKKENDSLFIRAVHGAFLINKSDSSVVFYSGLDSEVVFGGSVFGDLYHCGLLYYCDKNLLPTHKFFFQRRRLYAQSSMFYQNGRLHHELLTYYDQGSLSHQNFLLCDSTTVDDIYELCKVGSRIRGKDTIYPVMNDRMAATPVWLFNSGYYLNRPGVKSPMF